MGVKVIYRVQSAAQMVLIIVDDLHYLSVPETEMLMQQGVRGLFLLKQL